jgi:exopolysaccharide biosynthesis polyprenyl glycosylphosphotransferase
MAGVGTMLHPETMARDRYYRRSLAVADLTAALAALVLSISVVGGDSANLLVFLGLPLVIFVSKIAGLYDHDELLVRKTTIHEIPALFNNATLYTLLCWLFSGLIVEGRFGWTEAVTLWFGFFVLAVAGRRIARLIASRMATPERLLLVGDAGTFVRLQEKLSLGEVNAELVGRLSLQRTTRVGGEERTVDEGTLRSLIEEFEVHRVLVVPSQSTPAVTLDLVRTAKALGTRVSIVPQVMDVVGNAVVFDDVLGLTLLGVRSFDLSRSSLIAKRAMDVVGACVCLVLLGPFIIAVAIAIKLDSRGPVFFRQSRVGHNDQIFRIYKFRSMVADAEERKQALIETGLRGGLFKIRDDPRVTRVGRLLRRTSLDELPQIFNVLRGEMSLVGPRPLIASEDQAIMGYDRHRVKLTPGMTGPWQLMGSRVPLNEMVKLDYLYVSGWTLMADIGILLRTLRHVMLRKGV